jgi:hypothetical protein
VNVSLVTEVGGKENTLPFAANHAPGAGLLYIADTPFEKLPAPPPFA